MGRCWGLSMPRDSAYSARARWQNMYWSGIWMLCALCARIFSTVPRMSMVPESSRRDTQISKVQNVPGSTTLGFSWVRQKRLYYLVHFASHHQDLLYETIYIFLIKNESISWKSMKQGRTSPSNACAAMYNNRWSSGMPCPSVALVGQ